MLCFLAHIISFRDMSYKIQPALRTYKYIDIGKACLDNFKVPQRQNQLVQTKANAFLWIV